MIYKITYQFNGKTLSHISMSVRETDVFLDILLALKCDYIKIITFTKESVKK